MSVKLEYRFQIALLLGAVSKRLSYMTVVVFVFLALIFFLRYFLALFSLLQFVLFNKIILIYYVFHSTEINVVQMFFRTMSVG